MDKKKTVLLLLTDKWNDWEASYAIAVINTYSEYVVKTIAIDKTPKVSMGNLSTNIDYSIDQYNNFSEVAMVILPGGVSWEKTSYDEIVAFIKMILSYNIPISAICGATTFLCKHGFLDTVKHTGDSLELFQSQNNYKGQSHYIHAEVVIDGNIMTAKETAAVQFAYEIFKILKVDSDEEMAQWYDTFKNGTILIFTGL